MTAPGSTSRGLAPGAVVDLPDGPWDLAVAGPLDLSAVVLGADGRVAGDGDLVFFNAPAASGVRLRGAVLTVDAGRLRRGAERVVLLASPADGSTPLGRLPAPRLEVSARGRPVATATAYGLSRETVAQLAEVYRRGPGWRLRALGDGYDDGLAGLARAFGVEVDDDAPAAGVVDEVLALTDAERARHGLGALRAEPRLRAAAQRHSEDMVARGYFAHESPEGRSVADRVRDEGYAYGVVAENIAAGQRSPAEVVQAWMDSPGHRANLLRPEVQELGVGVAEGGPYGTTWTQVFGRPLGQPAPR